jgi:hypothetical protein
MFLLRVPPLGWLRFVPPGPTGVVGLMLFILGAIPPGEAVVLYLAVGCGVLGVAWLAAMPARMLHRVQNRLFWPLGISAALAAAFVLPAVEELMWVGGGLGVVAALSALTHRVREAYLTLPEAFAEIVGWSDGIEYAALFDVAPGGPVKVLWTVDPSLARHLRRFALVPPDADDKAAEGQVAAWDAVALRLHAGLAALDGAFAATGQGENVRAVFDIDMGGLFLTRIHPSRFLFAATLNQAVMNDDSCDRDVRALVRAITLRTSAHRAADVE